MSLMNLTAVQLGKKIKSGEVKVEDAVLDAFAQIEAVESDINSYVTVLEKRPDVEKMQQAAAYLEGKHDYKSFCGNPRMKKSTVRVVDKIEITRKGSFIYFDFHGTGFLQNMVRILVGTLLEVGKGKIKPEQIPEILEAKNRQMAGPTAPAQGLCLIKVDY